MAVFISFLLQTATVYSFIGVLFAIVFVWKGVSVLDESAAHSSVLPRLLWFTGAVLLWPLLVYSWLKIYNRLK